MLPHGNGHERPRQVVQIPNKTVRAYGSSVLGRVGEISLITKIINNLNRIEGKLNRRSVRAYILISIVKRIRNERCWNSGGALPITDAGRSKSEVARVDRYISGEREVRETVRAPIVIRQ